MNLNAWLLTLSLLQVGDVGTSIPLWNRGYSELNPLYYHQKPVVASMQIGGVIAGEWYLAKQLEKKHPKWAKALIIGGVVFASINVARNINYLRESR